MPTSSTAAPAQQAIAGDASHLIAHLNGNITPVRPSPAYFAAMILALATALLALALYFAIIALSGWGIYLWAQHLASLARATTKSTPLFMFLHAFGILAASLILLALIKPIFLPKQEEQEPVELDENAQPMLHAYLGALAERVGAPKPSRIYTDGSVNAYARPRPVLFGLLGMRYDLCVGMLLFEGMSAREVTGVIAHELGHFSQGTAMRVVMVTRSIALWFAKVAYVRDIWDYRLWLFSQTNENFLGLIVGLIVLFSELVRLIPAFLYLIICAGDAILSREMEHDADRFETRVAGTQGSISITRRLIELNIAADSAAPRINQWLAKGRIPSDLPKVFARQARQLPAEQLSKRVKLGVGAKRNIFASHPTGSERIARATAENTPGICTLEGPGTILLMSPHLVSEAVTREMVRECLGPDVDRKIEYAPVTEFIREHEDADKAIDTLRAILGDVANTLSIEPIFISADAISPSDDPAATLARMTQAKAALKATRPAAQPHAQAMRAADAAHEQALHARALLKMHIRIKAAEFGLKASTLAAADTALDEARTNISFASGGVEPATKALRTYIYAGLQLIMSKKADPLLPSRATLAAETKKLFETHAALRRIWPAINELQRTRTTMEAFFQQSDGGEPGELLIRELNTLLAPTHEHMNLIEQETHQLTDPFAAATEYRSLWQALFPLAPQSDLLSDWISCLSIAIDTYHALNRRLLVRLMELASLAEKSATKPK